MSARQPFVPSSRPSSRAAHPNDAPDSSASAPQFTPEASNPLHRLTAPHVEKEHDNPGFSSKHKPLDLSSLLKKRSQARKSLENIIVRPGTADIVSGSHTLEQNQNQSRRPNVQGLSSLKIAAPSPTAPYSSNPSAFLSLDGFAFKAPALPLSSSKQLPNRSSDDQLSSNAHIPTAMADTESNMLTSGLLLESRFQSAATIQSFETMHGSAEVVERRDPPGFGVDTPGAAEGGPQRVLIDLTGGNSGSTLIGKRNRSKRSKSYDEDNSEDEYVRQAKRYVSQKKGGVLMRGHNRQMEYVSMAPSNQSPRHSSPDSHHSYNQGPGTASPEIERTYLSQQQHHHALAPSPPSHQPQRPTRRHHKNGSEAFQNREHRQPDALESSLSKILGIDVDAYVNEHLEVYEEAKKKWEGCTMEEWVAGADELCSEFGKVLDFVKDHITTKVKLYASLDKTLADHGAVLEERDKVLAEARASLVADGANVLGGV